MIRPASEQGSDGDLFYARVSAVMQSGQTLALQSFDGLACSGSATTTRKTYVFDGAYLLPVSCIESA